tara:strand:- start:1255 stop:2178 length:924 start_codon:yes stop_codon:yes gene_type:complete
MMHRLKTISLILPLGLLLGACAETELVLHTAKQMTSHAPAKTSGHYKIGNPYQISGLWYYPAVDYNYVETGIASWYGPKFHGRQTANGGIFDMNAVTAAHRTLPLPSMVRVTNLKNGRSLKVLVNDRGPYAKNRIIDLSRRSAQLLGFQRAGTAPVKVEIIADESRQLAAIAQGQRLPQVAAAPSDKVNVAALPGSQAPASVSKDATPPVRTEAVEPLPDRAVMSRTPITAKPRIYVQAGAFVYRDLADKMKRLLDPIGPTQIAEAVIGERRFYRVRIGPLSSVKKADQLLELVTASGYPEARLVVD